MALNPHIKKILRDYNYYYESLLDVKDISSIAEGEFRNAMINSGDQEALKALIPDETQTAKIKELENSVEDVVENHNDKEFKKVFRKIVIKCHPDKIKEASEKEAEFLKECYENATAANNNYDWGLLLRVAGQLDIEDIELSHEQIQTIRKRNEDLQKEINKYENSMAYQWYTKDDEKARERFLAICLGVFKGSLKKD
jgi:hypothetical protein